MKRIPLGGKRGGEALVDDDVYVWASEVRWTQNADGYVVRRHEGKVVYMHRVILGLLPGDGIEADHRDRNGLNNQRVNLRVGGRALNAQNVGSVGKTSRFRGVSRVARNHGKPWVAQSGFAGKTRHLGYFADEVEAARAAQAFRDEHMPWAEPDPELKGL